jgi:predicted metalloprotease
MADSVGRKPSSLTRALYWFRGDTHMFRRGTRLDPTQVQDRRGVRGGGIAAVGSGMGVLILLIAGLLLGVDLSAVVDDGSTTANPESPIANCQTGEDANQSEDCRIVGFVNSIQAFWDQEFGRVGASYPEAQTVLFSGVAQTGCGTASSQVGPFYCPPDQRVYIDLDFFRELQTRFGAEGGPFAQAYVLAHEYGHHIQNLTGVLARLGNDRDGPQRAAVRAELQADCLAGLWAGHAVETGFIEAVTEQEIGEALSAAAAVGDDRIQQSSTGRVNPESWTHGSSEQRQEWFLRGYRGRSAGDCDTFTGNA